MKIFGNYLPGRRAVDVPLLHVHTRSAGTMPGADFNMFTCVHFKKPIRELCKPKSVMHFNLNDDAVIVPKNTNFIKNAIFSTNLSCKLEKKT